MGYAKKKMIMTLVLEGLIIFLIYDLSAAIGYAAIASKSADFGLLFGEYEPLNIKFILCFQAVILFFIVFVLPIYDIHLSSVKKLKHQRSSKAY